MRRMRIRLAIILSLLMGVSGITASLADGGNLHPVQGNPLTVATAPFLYMSGLAGQSACSITVSGSFSGTINIEGLYPGSTTYTSALQLAAPDGSSYPAGVTAPGTLIFNCATMAAFRADATGVTGTPIVTLNASGGVGRVVFQASGGGGGTTVGAISPIVRTTPGGIQTLGLLNPLPIANGGTNATALSSGCLVSNGSQVSSTPCPSFTPVSVLAGAGTSVQTPSPGVFVVTNTGVTAVTGTGNIAVTAGPTPVVSITNAPTFTGNVTAGSVTANNLTSNDCLRSVAGLIQSASTDCANGAIGALTAGTGIAISTPNPNKPTVSLISPVAVVNGGTGNTAVTAGRCNDAASSTVIETSVCSQWAVASFVVPAIGSTVAITSAENKLFTVSKYTPIFVSDGVHAVQGYANASVANSASITLLLQNVDVGAVGDTVAANAFLSLSGLGSSGLAGVTAGNDIVVTTANPAKPTVAVTQSPTFTGLVTAPDFSAGAQGVGTIATGYRIGSSVGAAGQTIILPCPVGTVTQECIATGVHATVFNVVSTGPGISTSYMAADSNADWGIYGAWYAQNYYTGTKAGTAGTVGSVNTANVVAATSVTDNGLTSGRCVQAGTSGILGNSPGGACAVLYQSNTLAGGLRIDTAKFPSLAGLATGTLTFSPAFSSSPTCVASNTGAGNTPSVTINGNPSTSSVGVYNSAASMVDAAVICVGF